jgi:hypothetical protein
MAEPSARTGAVLMALGAALSTVGFLVEAMARAGWLTTLSAWLPALLQVLQFDLGPAFLAFGVGWLLSGLHPMRKWYLYPATAGLLVSTSSLTVTTYLLRPESYLPLSIMLSLTWAVGPALLTAGALAAVVVNRRVAKTGAVVSPNPHEDNLDVLVLVALYIPLLPLASSETFYLRYLLPAVITWFVWHFLADRFTIHLLLRHVKRGGVQLVAAEPPTPEETTLMNVVSRSYYPMAFGLGVTTTLTSVLDLLNIRLFGGDPFAATAGAALTSIVAIAAGSLYVGPVLWLFEDLGVRFFDRVRHVMRPPHIHSLADEMVEIYTFIFAPIGFTFAVADGDLALALILLGLAVHLILTISMTATYLYIKFSARRHLYRVIESLKKKGVLTELSHI